jgi:hypothetical protein
MPLVPAGSAQTQHSQPWKRKIALKLSWPGTCRLLLRPIPWVLILNFRSPGPMSHLCLDQATISSYRYHLSFNALWSLLAYHCERHPARQTPPIDTPQRHIASPSPCATPRVVKRLAITYPSKHIVRVIALIFHIDALINFISSIFFKYHSVLQHGRYPLPCADFRLHGTWRPFRSHICRVNQICRTFPTRGLKICHLIYRKVVEFPLNDLSLLS